MGGDSPGIGFWLSMADGVEDGLEGLAAVCRGLVTLVISGLPLYLLLALTGWLLWRRRRRPQRAG